MFKKVGSLEEIYAKPDYMDGKWHFWSGGECPVPNGTETEIHLSVSGIRREINPESLRWKHDVSNRIIRFRVIRDKLSVTKPNYMDGNWHEWKGGECPVPGDVCVQISTRLYPHDYEPKPAKSWGWRKENYNPITRFRVVLDETATTNPASPVQMKPVIVPGVYGDVMVGETDGEAVMIGLDRSPLTTENVKYGTIMIPYDAEDLTAIIVTLTEIRDALKEQDQ